MRAGFALLALVLLVVAFAALAPATLVDQRVASATEGRLRLADARGTAWDGSGMLADARGAWRVPIAWRLDAWPLVRGALALRLQPAGTGDPRGSLLAEGNTLRIDGLHLELPAAAIETAWRRPPVPRLGGTIGVDAPAFATDGTRSDGAFDVRWSRATVALGGLRAALGTVEAHGRSGEGGLVVALSSSGGDAVLRGTATVRNGSVAVDATLTPTPALAPAAAAALRALGPAGPDGSVHVTWQARR